ncbi:hypothetical protein [Candidatus Uabimicrobium sp. HlEnr_7]|uniref:hypothetical protein n=1 Tax=Candidatus Uabimicrobium helgolandensis TaxID=3095367 RepID=UPI003556BEBB
MQNLLVIDALLEQKQGKHREFLFAILEWEAFLGNSKTWNTIVKKFFYHINKKTPSSGLAIACLRRLSRGNNIMVAPLQMQLQLIRGDLRKVPITKKNINEFLDSRLESKVDNFAPIRKNFAKNINKYILCVSTIDSVLRCFSTHKDSLLHGIYTGKIYATYINGNIIFHYQEICDFYTHSVDCTLEIKELVESGVEEHDILQKISMGAIRAIYKEGKLFLHKEDVSFNYPNFATTPSPQRAGIDISGRVERFSTKFGKSATQKKEVVKKKRSARLRLSKGKTSAPQKPQKIKIDLEQDLSLTKRIQETLLEKEDQKPIQRHRLQVNPEEMGVTARIKNALLQQEMGITQRIKKAVGKTEDRISIGQGMIKLFSAIGKTIKFAITVPLVIAIFPFKFVFSAGKRVFLWFSQRNKQKIVEVEIPAFEAMLSEEAGRPGIIERTLAQSKLLLKALQMTIGLRIVVFINFCDSLVEFVAGYVSNIYRTWKMGKSIKRRIERHDVKMQIAGITDDLEIVRSRISQLFQFAGYNEKQVKKAFTLDLIYDLRYRMDEMKRDLSLLTKEQMTHTAKSTLGDFIKSFVPNPLELFTPCKDFIIFAFVMKYSRKDIYVMYGEMLMSCRFIVKSLDKDQDLLLDSYEDSMIASLNKNYNLRNVEQHINECKQQIQRFIQVLTNPRKMIDARHLSIEDLSYEHCQKGDARLSLQLQFEKVLRKRIEKKFTLSSKWHLQDKIFFERRYRLQRKLYSIYC